jgi:dihydrodipicolinate synthase/N-acetylneuraminate lyase
MRVRQMLREGLVIPAHPLALNARRQLDERRQRALSRYYIAAGAGGLAIGVHTTQFAIRDPKIRLLEPVLELAMDEMRAHDLVKIAGVCGARKQAIAESELAAKLGYDAVLLSLGALRNASTGELIDHARAIAPIIPVIGFYLQPAVGGRLLGYEFWRQFAEIPNVVAIKIAPFNRYQTLDVARAVAQSGRNGEIALYTGNDDHILLDLLTEFDFAGQRTRIVGGLLGQWAVWTRAAVQLLNELKHHRDCIPLDLLTLAQQITDVNAAIFDPVHDFRGCIPGIHEVLRRSGLLEEVLCLDAHEQLSPGQSEEIDRIYRAYPHLRLTDEKLIEENLDRWLR